MMSCMFCLCLCVFSPRGGLGHICAGRGWFSHQFLISLGPARGEVQRWQATRRGGSARRAVDVREHMVLFPTSSPFFAFLPCLFLSFFLPSFLSFFIPFCFLPSFLACLLACLLALFRRLFVCLFVSFFLPSFLPSFLPFCLSFSLPFFVSVCLSVFVFSPPDTKGLLDFSLESTPSGPRRVSRQSSSPVSRRASRQSSRRVSRQSRPVSRQSCSPMDFAEYPARAARQWIPPSIPPPSMLLSTQSSSPVDPADR